MQMRSTPDLSFNRVVIVSVCEKPQLVMAKAPGKLAGMDTTLKSKGSGWSEDLWFRNRLSALTVDGLLPSVVPSGSQGSLTDRLVTPVAKATSTTAIRWNASCLCMRGRDQRPG
jgi:hypothetical protein